MISGDWEDDRIKGVITWEVKHTKSISVGLFQINKKWEIFMEEFGVINFRNGDKYTGNF